MAATSSQGDVVQCRAHSQVLSRAHPFSTPCCAAGLFKPSAALPDASLLQGQLQVAKSEIDKLAALVAADMYGAHDGSFSGAGSPFGTDLIKSVSVAEVETSQYLVSTQNALRCAAARPGWPWLRCVDYLG
jgi:hypothetical protein